MSILTRDGLLLIKVEGTAGSEQAPANTDAIAVEAAEPSFEIGYGERPLINSSQVDALPVRTTRKVSIAITVRLRGSGVAANATKWSRLLQASGFKVAGTTTSILTPDVTQRKTLTAYYYVGGLLYKMFGAAFADPTISYDGGWKLSGTLVGKDGGVTTTAAPASPTFDTGAYLSGLGCTFSYGGYSAVLRSLSISLGPQIAECGNLNDATGYAYFLATAFTPGGTMVVEDVAISTKDLRGLALAQQPATTEALSFVIGSAAGSIIEVSMPNCRLGSWTEGNDGGIRTLEFPLHATDLAAGAHNWIEIVTK